MMVENYRNQIFEEGKEEGIAVGKAEGIAAGKEEANKAAILNMLKDEVPDEKIFRYYPDVTPNMLAAYHQELEARNEISA